MMGKSILEIQNISKEFVIGKNAGPYLSLRDSLSEFFKPSARTEKFKALDDVSFDVYEGDTLGIIGKNGAGKSTLLKILSRITPPTSGKIISRGRIASLLEVGTGFHAELTGRENVFMNGSILGMKRSEIVRNFDAIVDFAGIEKFIDTPLKHYSSGMQLRLAFAVAAFMENEILIIDEVLAVGDAEFQKKCMGKMDDVSKSGRTILFVSHNMGAVASLCKTSIHMQQGKLISCGTTEKVIEEYISETDTSRSYISKKSSEINQNFIRSITPVNEDLIPVSEFDCSKTVNLLVKLTASSETRDLQLGIALLDGLKNKIFTNHHMLPDKKDLETSVLYKIPANTLCPGRFSFDAALFTANVSVYDYLNDICPINVIDNGTEMYQFENYGRVFINCSWNEIA